MALCRCIVCLFPAASVILSLGFTVVYLIALWLVTSRLAATVINRSVSSVQALRRPLPAQQPAKFVPEELGNPLAIPWTCLYLHA